MPLNVINNMQNMMPGMDMRGMNMLIDLNMFSTMIQNKVVNK